MIMAALTQINPALYEAATMDGAGRWKKTLHITIPGIMPIIVLVFILKLGSIVNNAGFDQVVNLYSPMVYETGDILDTMTYRLAFDSTANAIPQYDIATAVGLMRSVVSCVLVSISYYIAHKFADYRIF
jgi:putative aldouronate transport system permease protein